MAYLGDHLPEMSTHLCVPWTIGFRLGSFAGKLVAKQRLILKVRDAELKDITGLTAWELEGITGLWLGLFPA